MCPQKQKEGASCQPLQPRQEWGPKRWQTLSLRGWAKLGLQGAKPPGGGSWGVSLHKFKRRGEPLPLATSPRVGPKTLANPQPARVGKRGWRGRSPLPGGMGDVPLKAKNRGRAAHISNPATSGTRNAGEPKAYEGGQTGVQGAKPPGGGCGGVSPHKTLKRGRLLPPATPPRVGPKPLANPQLTGVGAIIIPLHFSGTPIASYFDKTSNSGYN